MAAPYNGIGPFAGAQAPDRVTTFGDQEPSPGIAHLRASLGDGQTWV